MRIETIVVGELETNCYLLFDDKTKEVLIVDPGDEADRIIDQIGDYKLLGILVTHTHDDHIGAIPTITDKYKCPIYDKYNLEEGSHQINNFKFDVIYTPGHLEDQIVYYFKEYNLMFVGDFIFKNSIGRVDLEGGDFLQMIQSINKILTYDEDIIIYPGHGEITNLKDEKNNLKYFISIL